MTWIRSSTAVSLLLAGSLALWAQGPAPVQLRASAEVRGAVIRLSDLLPAGAASELQAAAQSVELGRAPQAGSERVLLGEQVVQRVAEEPRLAGRVSVPARVTIRRVAWPLDRQAVRNAVAGFLQAHGIPASQLPPAEGLEWPGNVLALAEHPALEVTGASWDGRQRALELRLRCVERGLCGSFVVSAHASRPEMFDRQPLRSATGQFAQPRPAGAALARPGQKAILVLERDGMRLSLPVICLERGGLRDRVRVREARGQRVFQARVVGAGIVHAAF
jgi:hypothetical protein